MQNVNIVSLELSIERSKNENVEANEIINADKTNYHAKWNIHYEI